MSDLPAGRIPARSGVAFELRAGQRLRVTDPEGGQVADLWCVALADPGEWLSTARTIDYGGTLRPSTGSVLFSNRSRELLEILEDDVGVHDLLFAPCSPEMFARQYDAEGPQPNCLDNLAGALAPWGVERDRITVPLNLFMRSEVAPDGAVDVCAGASRAGEGVLLRARVDLAVGLSACSAGKACGGRFGPVDYQVLEA